MTFVRPIGRMETLGRVRAPKERRTAKVGGLGTWNQMGRRIMPPPYFPPPLFFSEMPRKQVLLPIVGTLLSGVQT